MFSCSAININFMGTLLNFPSDTYTTLHAGYDTSFRRGEHCLTLLDSALTYNDVRSQNFCEHICSVE